MARSAEVKAFLQDMKTNHPEDYNAFVTANNNLVATLEKGNALLHMTELMQARNDLEAILNKYPIVQHGVAIDQLKQKGSNLANKLMTGQDITADIAEIKELSTDPAAADQVPSTPAAQANAAAANNQNNGLNQNGEETNPFMANIGMMILGLVFKWLGIGDVMKDKDTAVAQNTQPAAQPPAAQPVAKEEAAPQPTPDQLERATQAAGKLSGVTSPVDAENTRKVTLGATQNNTRFLG